VAADEVAELWRMTGVMSQTITFPGFVRFLHYQILEPRPPQSFMQSLACSRERLLALLMRDDPESTGTVALAEFRTACLAVRPHTAEYDIHRLAQHYDVGRDGHVHFYLLLSDLEPVPPGCPPDRAVNREHDPFNLDMFPAARYASSRAGVCSSSHARVRSSIIQKLWAAIQSHGTAEQFFNAFQNNSELGTREIAGGCRLPIAEVEKAMGRGGPFNQQEFCDVVAQWGSLQAEPINVQLRRQATEEGVVMGRIAERTAGRNWEEVTRECGTANEFARALRNVQVYVSADDIRSMFERGGRDGFVAAIKEYSRTERAARFDA
jgi:hypothetical protein